MKTDYRLRFLLFFICPLKALHPPPYQSLQPAVKNNAKTSGGELNVGFFFSFPHPFLICVAIKAKSDTRQLHKGTF